MFGVVRPVMQDVMRSSKKSRDSDGSSKESVRSTEEADAQKIIGRRTDSRKESYSAQYQGPHSWGPGTPGSSALRNPPPEEPVRGGEERRAWSGSNLLSWIPNGGVQGARTEMILRSTYLRAGCCAACRDR